MVPGGCPRPGATEINPVMCQRDLHTHGVSSGSLTRSGFGSSIHVLITPMTPRQILRSTDLKVEIANTLLWICREFFEHRGGECIIVPVWDTTVYLRIQGTDLALFDSRHAESVSGQTSGRHLFGVCPPHRISGGCGARSITCGF